MEEVLTRIILWEWENDLGWWIPYEPAVASLLEKEYEEDRSESNSSDPVPLAEAQQSLSRYEILFSFADDHATCAGFQRNTSTGNQRRIRRRLVAGDKNVLWRWQGDAPEHTWHPYAYDISLKLESIKSECELNQTEPEMDLQTYFANYPYTVDVLKCTQRRNSTGFTRPIRRDEDVRFPRVDTAGNGQENEEKSLDQEKGEADAQGNRENNDVITCTPAPDLEREKDDSDLTTQDLAVGADTSSKENGKLQKPEGASCAIFVDGAPLPENENAEEKEEQSVRESEDRASTAAGPSGVVRPLSKSSFSVDENLTEELTSPTTPSSPTVASTSFSSCTGSFFRKFRARAKMSMTPISSTSTSVDSSQPSALSMAATSGVGGVGTDGSGLASHQCFQSDAHASQLASSVSLNPVGSSAQPESPGASHSPVIASKSAPDSLIPPSLDSPSVTLPSVASPSAASPSAATPSVSPSVESDAFGIQSPSNSDQKPRDDLTVTEPPTSVSRSPGEGGGGQQQQQQQRRRKKKSRLYFATLTKAMNYVPKTNSAVIDMTNMLLIPMSFQMVVTPAPIFYPPSTDPCYLLSVPGIPDPSRKAQKKLFKKKLLHMCVDDVLTKHATDVPTVTVRENLNETECGICMEGLTMPSSFCDDEVENSAVSRLNKCKHAFHRACLVAMYQSGSLDASLQCPQCKAIHGEKKGVCPPGFMDYYLNPKHSVPGYDDCDGTIVIVYYIKDGVQGPEHPNPEMPYFASGFPRQCYLPNNSKGRMILQLLIVAWERRLTFTIGVSATTGADNTVTWNEIHHKTEWGSNRTGHGYPDPNYLDNVLTELAIQGVTADDILPASTPIETISLNNESDPAVRPKGKKTKV